MHKYGYCLRARPVVAQKLLVRGQHFLSIAIKSNAGWLSIAGEVNSDELYQFVHCQLLSHLKPSYGSNEHSIAVMVNDVDGIVSMIEFSAVVILFLPPYPILTLSNHFSKLKKTNGLSRR